MVPALTSGSPLRRAHQLLFSESSTIVPRLVAEVSPLAAAKLAVAWNHWPTTRSVLPVGTSPLTLTVSPRILNVIGRTASLGGSYGSAPPFITIGVVELAPAEAMRSVSS